MKKALLLLLVSMNVNSADTFLFGGMGVGLYNKSMGDPEITTPQTLGNVNFGVGWEFEDDVDLRFELEHWSSMKGFPDVFHSEGEDGNGFNAIWFKVEKRFYQSKHRK